jgi:hypothetical protein
MLDAWGRRKNIWSLSNSIEIFDFLPGQDQETNGQATQQFDEQANAEFFGNMCKKPA